MARSLSSSKIVSQASGTLTNTLDDATTTSYSLSYSSSITLTDGVSSQQANRIWPWKNRTLTENASIIIDLYSYTGLDLGAGTGNDPTGQAMEPVEEIVFIGIYNDNTITDAGRLEIRPDTTNGWIIIGEHTVGNEGALRGKGSLIKSQPADPGFPVSASRKRIKLTAIGGSVTYSVIVMGRHDADESSSSSTSSQSSSTSSVSSSSSSSSSSSGSSSASSISASSQSNSSSSSSSVSTSSVSSSSSSTSSISTSSQSSSSQSSSSSSSASSVSSVSSSSMSSSSSSESSVSTSSSSSSSASTSSSS